MFPRRLDLTEHSDGSDARPEVVRDTLLSLASLNAGLLRTHAILLSHLRPLLVPGGSVRVIEYGSGAGDAARSIALAGVRAGCRVQVLGVDLSPLAVTIAEGLSPGWSGVTFSPGDALCGGPDPAEYDFAFSSSLLHHLRDDDAVGAILARTARARRGFVHLDLVRSAIPWALFAVFGRPLCRRRETFQDGLTSVRRSLTLSEAAGIAARAAPGARVEAHWPWRLCISRVDASPQPP